MPVFIIWLLVVGGMCVIAGIVWSIIEDDGFYFAPTGIVGIVALIIAFSCLAHWGIRKNKTPMLNDFFNTDYTEEQVFWGGEMLYDLHKDYEVGKYERKKVEVDGIEINIGE